MIIFIYDKTFDGLLTAIFDAYSRKQFPDLLQGEGEPLPLFYDECVIVVTDETRAGRVWKALEKKLSPAALTVLSHCWLSELPEVDNVLFRYIRKAVDAPASIEVDFADPDVLFCSQLWKKVNQEKYRLIQFLRFQKTRDGIFFALVEPIFNVLPLTIHHFRDRFADQSWIIYDKKRKYGYYYDLEKVEEISFGEESPALLSSKLSDDLLDQNELLFQELWRTYFRSITIQERKNPKLHRQNLPVRFWKYLTEKQ